MLKSGTLWGIVRSAAMIVTTLDSLGVATVVSRAEVSVATVTGDAAESTDEATNEVILSMKTRF